MSRLIGLLVLWGCGWGAPCVAEEDLSLASRFASEPTDTLAGQFQGGTSPSVVVPGLAAEQRAEVEPGSGRLIVRTTLVNRSDKAQPVERVVLADWSFRSDPPNDAGFQPLTYRNDVWYDSTYWSGPDWTRVGRNWHHPGENTPSVRRFIAPEDGQVTVTGRAFKLHVTPTDGVRLAIRHNDHVVWQAEIAGDDAQGVEPHLTLQVRRGDRLRFIVEKRGAIVCDTTGWDPAIAYADGQRYVASEGFAPELTAGAVWSYEMASDAATTVGQPRLWGLDAAGLLVEEPLAVGQTLEHAPGNSAPRWILADGTDRSGLALAVTGEGAWRLRAERDAQRIRIMVEADWGRSVEAGATVALPALAVAAYRGPWLAGAASFGEDAELELAVQADWRQEDRLDGTQAAYHEAARRHLAGGSRLLDALQRDHAPAFPAEDRSRWNSLAQAVEQADTLPAARQAYLRVRQAKRELALANPLLDFGPLLFVKRVPTSYSHLVMQYFGWRARAGGGLFVLERPGRSAACRDLLAGALSGGNVLEPRLSYDGRQIVFSYVECAGQSFDPAAIGNDDADQGFYHIYTVNVDGTGLRQLTRGPFDDMMPTWLPDGGIAFCSTRRRGYARCFGAQFSRRWHVYTLHRMEADGTGLRTLSYHDTNEWFPAVSHTGQILYARWDYIDRDAVTHQTLWATRPDGTNPVALWGNGSPSPHCTFQLQPVPGSQKVVCTASAHHSITGGSVVLIDPTVSDNGHGALTRITPEIPFPEAETRDIGSYYDSPWPLSEEFFLVGFSHKPLVWEPGANDPAALGIYLLDAFGNRELLYRDPTIGSANPCPLVARPAPPALPSVVPNDAPGEGEMLLVDVYAGLGDVPRDTIRQLRIVQIFPKTTNVANAPPIGAALEENARAILGTVPVEADGSARFRVPAGRPLLFQALDADGQAYQTMRTVTYVQPGERITCVGCHEQRRGTPPPRTGAPLALEHPPATIDPGELGGRPFSFVEVVQPLLQQHCVACHRAEKAEGGIDLSPEPAGGFTRAYVALTADVDFWGEGTNPENARRALVPRFGGRNVIQVTSPGGQYGSRGSRLMKLLRDGHAGVALAPAELRRLAAWIDLNATFYGVYAPDDQARQLRGELLAMPEIQ